MIKKLVLGLMLTAVAVGGSAFKNAKRSITENYMIQIYSGYFVRVNMANGSCWNLHTGMQCKYAVTNTGRLNIPSQFSYTDDDIQDYLNEGWLEFAQLSNRGIYLIIS